MGLKREWVWYVFVLGLSTKVIAERCGVEKSEVLEFVEGVLLTMPPLRNALCQATLDGVPRQPWKERQDKIMLRLKYEGFSLEDTARLLYRNPNSVKQRWKELYGEGK